MLMFICVRRWWHHLFRLHRNSSRFTHLLRKPSNEPFIQRSIDPCVPTIYEPISRPKASLHPWIYGILAYPIRSMVLLYMVCHGSHQYIPVHVSISHRIHVWYIYLHDWVIYGVNVGIHIPYMEHMGIYQHHGFYGLNVINTRRV